MFDWNEAAWYGGPYLQTQQITFLLKTQQNIPGTQQHFPNTTQYYPNTTPYLQNTTPSTPFSQNTTQYLRTHNTKFSRLRSVGFVTT